MKTAVSVPDELFRTAEAVARSLEMSRIQLYSTAISEFIESRETCLITEQLNRVYAVETENVDPARHNAQLQSLAKEQW